MNTQDVRFMNRCLTLARRGYGYVNPNPMVGAVIVKNGIIISEGFHSRLGGDHAEIKALRKAGKRGLGATLYVNLEPCNHLGRTPPCTAAIVEAGINRVVYAIDDPNPDVAGNGKNVLIKNGIEVTSGVLHNEAQRLNEHFIFAMRSGLPFVILKAAATLDGYIADKAGKSKWISGDASRQAVQEIRKGVDAVLVGANTICEDDPRLTVHSGVKFQPYRIILDGRLRTPLNARVYNDQFRDKTIVVCADSNKNRKKVERLRKKNVSIIFYKGVKSLLPLRGVLRDLRRREINSILVEGGGKVFRQCSALNIYAKAVYFIAPKLLGGGLPVMSGINRSLQSVRSLDDVTIKQIGGDVMIAGYTVLYKKYMY
jgi:diaminohydroxyphosphoribosylaminopyrimidine deaminase / 5-amino-6-(5-phosphoribosylamino)uracil reductase